MGRDATEVRTALPMRRSQVNEITVAAPRYLMFSDYPRIDTF